MDGDTYFATTGPKRRDSKSSVGDGIIDARSRIRHARRSSENLRRRYRVLFYSHDSMGLGHIRRNILLAQCLGEADLEIDVLLISGARESGGFDLPANVDVVVMPALHKTIDGSYRARNLDVDLDELCAIRGQIVCSTIQAFQPDVVIVDNVARGANGELDCALRYIRDHGGIRCVLGLRDIQDESVDLQREWKSRRCLETIRDYYHAVWVYGDSQVFDPRHEYNLPADIAHKLRFTGYLDPRKRLQSSSVTECKSELPDVPFGLCLVGGGQDGAELALAFAQARHPASTAAVIITGPYIDPDCLARLKQLASQRPNLSVFDFVREPTRILREASYVVCMGGYNTVCEVIAYDKPALIVPRIVPRREQIVRADRLQQLGIVDMLHPHSLSAESLSRWIMRLPAERRASNHSLIDMNATQRIPRFFNDELRQLDNGHMAEPCRIG